MMATDPGLQKLPLWTILNPSPFPNEARGDPSARIAVAEQMVEGMRQQFPKFYAAHPMKALEADEEVFLMLLTFICSVPMHGARTPSYREWMVAQDCTEWYAYLRQMLQFIQWQNGSRELPWLLKAPWHFRWMDILFDTFPNATIVHCYRDPLETVASMAALFEESRKMTTDYEHPHEIGQMTCGYWSNAVGRFLESRSRLESTHRFIDISYEEILADPLEAIEKIYSVASLSLTEQARAAMQAWQAENPQHKHGRHNYTLERFGLSENEVREKFASYISFIASRAQ